MSYETIGRNLMNYGVYGYALSVSANGKEVVWLRGRGNAVVYETSWYLDFDILSGFDFLREAMQTETLVISWTSFNTFEAELSHKKRDVGFGYTEPLQKEVTAVVNGYSILEVLGLLNEKIEKSKQEVNTSLELVKK